MNTFLCLCDCQTATRLAVHECRKSSEWASQEIGRYLRGVHHVRNCSVCDWEHVDGGENCYRLVQCWKAWVREGETQAESWKRIKIRKGHPGIKGPVSLIIVLNWVAANVGWCYTVMMPWVRKRKIDIFEGFTKTHENTLPGPFLDSGGTLHKQEPLVSEFGGIDQCQAEDFRIKVEPQELRRSPFYPSGRSQPMVGLG